MPPTRSAIPFDVRAKGNGDGSRRYRSAAEQTDILHTIGHEGPMASIVDDELDVTSGKSLKRTSAVTKATASLTEAIRGSSVLSARLLNTYGHDRKADGSYTGAQKFGFKHRDALLDRHRRELNLRDDEGVAAVAYSADNDRVCTSLHAAWTCQHERIGARVHTMTTSKAYRNNKPTSVDDLKARFHDLYGRIQHDMMVENLDREFAIVTEGPGGDTPGQVQSVRVEVFPDASWQRDWNFYYEVLDGVLQELLPATMNLPLDRAVFAKPQTKYKTNGR